MAIDKTQAISKELANLYIQYFNQRKGDFKQPINLSLNNPTHITINDNEQIIEYEGNVIPVYETIKALLTGQAIGIYDSGMVYQGVKVVVPVIPPVLRAPMFSNNAGSTQNWTRNTAINLITVPQATGNPTPVYSVVGSLPTGLNFDVNTRRISGTPTKVGNGTIRIRATNSQGSDDWTISYVTVMEIIFTIPSFADNTGDAQNWIENQAITSITVPAANGNPVPVYSVVGNLPTGLNFDVNTRRISGTPTVVNAGVIRIRATNTQGTSDWTITYNTVAALTLPVFADNTGDAQNWIQNSAITSIIVPQATGHPVPVYSVVGNLPAGLLFNTSTRRISGTPTVIGTGTITIRATNSQGTADWTVGYNTIIMPITLASFDTTGILVDCLALITSKNAPSLYADSTRGGTDTVTDGELGLGSLQTVISKINYQNNILRFNDNNVPGSLNLRTYFNSLNYIIYIQVAGQDRVTIPINSIDSAGGNYININVPAGDARTLLNSLVEGTVFIIAVGIPSSIPVFADDTGDDQDWIRNTAIVSIVVPAAIGTPTPVYTIAGLPAGLNFDANTRTISGTPSAISSGTITVTATNSEGTDDWTLEFDTVTDLILPNFVDNTGNAQNWTQNSAIVSITIPEAVGNPTPVYSVVGSLPAGLLFNTNTRVLSGTPSVVGNGTITIRATNSEGSDDWTVGYTTAMAAPVDLMPRFTTSITNIVIVANTPINQILPVATGGDTPLVYSILNLPSGLSFNANTRRLTGTVTTAGAYSPTYRVTDVDGDIANIQFSITVMADLMPVFPSIDNIAVDAGATIDVILPEATGGDTPLTYSITGFIPNGLSFNPTTRRLTGSLSTAGFYRITYVVTDVDGDTDSARIAIAVTAVVTSNIVTIVIPSTEITVDAFNVYRSRTRFDNIDLGTTLSINGTTRLWLQELSLRHTAGSQSTQGRINISLVTSRTDTAFRRLGPDFSTQMEQHGTITFEASDGDTVVVTGIIETDIPATEPYAWIPSNAADVAAFATHVTGLTDKTLTITFNDNS